MLSKNNTITSKDRHESLSVIENIEVYWNWGLHFTV